jgi:hypothetical protein
MKANNASATYIAGGLRARSRSERELLLRPGHELTVVRSIGRTVILGNSIVRRPHIAYYSQPPEAVSQPALKTSISIR